MGGYLSQYADAGRGNINTARQSRTVIQRSGIGKVMRFGAHGEDTLFSNVCAGCVMLMPVRLALGRLERARPDRNDGAGHYDGR